MHDQTRDILNRLISFNTISDRTNNPLIEYVAGLLRKQDIEPILFTNEAGNKTGLIATIGPNGPGGVILSGHSDVVPVEGQHWQSDPFTMIERDNKLFGRGTADMKGFIAVCLAQVPDMLKAKLKSPIHIMISYDEEITCEGVIPMLEYAKTHLPTVKAVFVGEPTMMQVLNGHKGHYGYSVQVTGKPAHSALFDTGISANTIAARLVVWLDDRLQDFESRSAPNAFSPNYTTCHAGQINGGTACNILAGECRFEWDLRTLPQEDGTSFLAAFRLEADRLLKIAQKRAPECAIEIIEDYAVPCLQPEAGGFAEALACELLSKTDIGVSPISSEAGLFQRAGYPTVLIGPGDMGDAHKANEFVEIEQLNKCESFIASLINYQSS